MIRIGLALLAFTLIAASQPSPPEHFGYAGFSLETLWSDMIDKFPHSSHEFWEARQGASYDLRLDGREKFQRTMANNSGKYLIRLSEDESKNGIYFIEFQIAAGRAEAVKLSFEEPVEFIKTRITSGAQRYPACAPILNSLTAQYGKPQAPQSNTEEALTATVRKWMHGAEQLALTCGHYYGEKKIFAMEITVSAATPH